MPTLSENQHAPERDLDGAAAKAVTTLFEVGRLWATHGLGVGRSALQASARTLRATAELLAEIEGSLGGDAPAAEPEEPADDA